MKRCISLLFVLMLVVSSLAFAEATPEEKLSDFMGTFKQKNAKKDIESRNAAIDKSTASINFAMRAFMRNRMRASSPIATTLTFSMRGGELSLSTDGGPNYIAPVDGTSQKTKSTRGDDIETSVTLAERPDGRLQIVQVFDMGRGTIRKNIYTLSESGKEMEFEVNMKAGPLPEPVVYTTYYLKK